MLPYILIALALGPSIAAAWEITSKNAAVTLVTGNNGYHAGALALGQSLVDIGSKLRRVVMVTSDVDRKSRETLSQLWEVRVVEPIACMHKVSSTITPDKYDLKGEAYLKGLERWKNTCTKFAAWTLDDFDRVVFIDADILVINPIDDALYGFSNASFVAAPEVFPPDTFNSGFIVLNPGKKEFQRIMDANRRVGSAEGGDQGVFNNGVCPDWFNAPPDDPQCGRLPWIFNVEVAHYASYNTLREMSGQRLPAALHFVSDGKPWTVLMFEYLTLEQQEMVSADTKRDIGKQVVAHMLWRRAFFKATNEPYPKTSFLLSCADVKDKEKKLRQQQKLETKQARREALLGKKPASEEVEGEAVSRMRKKASKAKVDKVEKGKGKAKSKGKKSTKRGKDKKGNKRQKRSRVRDGDEL